MPPPATIDGFQVLEWGEFHELRMPLRYTPPPDGRSPLEPMKYVAICRSPGVDGYYTLFCTAAWQHVTGEFNHTIDSAKQTPLREFGEDIVWQRQSTENVG